MKSAAGVVRAAASKVRIRLQHPGLLGAYGYEDVKAKTVAQRRAALRRAAKDLGWTAVVRRLNVLYIYNKVRHPATAALFREDREYASARLRR